MHKTSLSGAHSPLAVNYWDQWTDLTEFWQWFSPEPSCTVSQSTDHSPFQFISLTVLAKWIYLLCDFSIADNWWIIMHWPYMVNSIEQQMLYSLTFNTRIISVLYIGSQKCCMMYAIIATAIIVSLTIFLHGTRPLTPGCEGESHIYAQTNAKST